MAIKKNKKDVAEGESWVVEFWDFWYEKGKYKGRKLGGEQYILFIKSLLSTERRRVVEEILTNKHWIFTPPYGLEMENGEVVPRNREPQEYIRVDDLLSKLK